MKDLTLLVRPNILRLKPYSCARTEYTGKDASVFLDANENPYNDPLNRYPDPLQEDLKKRISQIKGVPAKQIFLGNGSDEAIDLMYRCFTTPRQDNVVAISPTYGMYEVCADINDVEYRAIPLEENFKLNANKLLQACDAYTKVIWLCSPNNPTGNHLEYDEIVKVLTRFEGIVVIDEAYSDFSRRHPFRLSLAKYPNLVVLNTMSKAWGCAAIRLGMAYASEAIISIMNKVKYPYNINLLTQKKALEMLNTPYAIDNWVNMIILERSRMIESFKLLPICEEVYPTNANFFLARMTDANSIYKYLIDRGIIVRNRNNVSLCRNCLRVTIGTKGENVQLLAALRQY
jgi:histidinol-phosphate aminotransferase